MYLAAIAGYPAALRTLLRARWAVTVPDARGSFLLLLACLGRGEGPGVTGAREEDVAHEDSHRNEDAACTECVRLLLDCIYLSVLLFVQIYTS